VELLQPLLVFVTVTDEDLIADLLRHYGYLFARALYRPTLARASSAHTNRREQSETEHN
jgi:hypothetical protein